MKYHYQYFNVVKSVKIYVSGHWLVCYILLYHYYHGYHMKETVTYLYASDWIKKTLYLSQLLWLQCIELTLISLFHHFLFVFLLPWQPYDFKKWWFHQKLIANILTTWTNTAFTIFQQNDFEISVYKWK